jgi:uncharacterized protein YcgI (DUF1989 family)
MTTYGKKRVDIVLQPVSGKALPVYKGEVLRIHQIEGGQCVDFNCYNLHDYKEFMSVGHTRRQGYWMKKGQFLWSAPPRFRPMLALLEKPETCVIDLLAARCQAGMLEIVFGFEKHTNCADTFAEAVGEYGLTPDDVHDSCNMWMNTGITPDGKVEYFWNTAKKEDYVDWLALMDVLAVPIVCGSGDVVLVSNYSLKPIGVQVFEHSQDTERMVADYNKEYLSLKNQRLVESFHVKEIKKDRELRPTPGYEPRFVNFPIAYKEYEIELSVEDYAQIQKLKKSRWPGTDEDVIRAAVMVWYLNNRRNKTWDIYYTGVKKD